MTEEHCDIVVIGAGAVGLACAIRLAQRGLSVRIVEASHCGAGASLASLGVLAPPSPLGKSGFNILHRRSLDSWPAFAEELKELSGVDLLFSRCGSLELLPSEAQYEQAQRECAAVSERGLKVDGKLAVELLSMRQYSELEPQALQCEFGAIYNRYSAHISVNRAMEALLKTATQLSVKITENCAVHSIDIKNDRVVSLTTGLGKIECEKVLLAAGVWSPQIKSGVEEYYQLEAVRGQGLLLRGENAGIQRMLKWKRGYVIPQADNFITIGASTEKDVGYEQSITLGVQQEIMQRAIETAPILSAFKVVRAWAGLRPMTIDRKPYFGAVPGAQGLFVAAGHYKIGFGYVPATAQSLAEMIVDGESSPEAETYPPRNKVGV